MAVPRAVKSKEIRKIKNSAKGKRKMFCGLNPRKKKEKVLLTLEKKQR